MSAATPRAARGLRAFGSSPRRDRNPEVARTTRRRIQLDIAATVGALLCAFAVGAVFIALIGQNPIEIYALMLRETLGTGYGLGQTLFKATPLIFTGLAVAFGFRAGLFNIGAEGQLYLGAFAAAWVGAAWKHGPFPLLMVSCLVAAAAAGAGWAAIPGFLKARFGSHEVINTIMMNFIAFALVSYLGQAVFEPASVHTAEIGAGAHIARLSDVFPALRGSPANFTLALGLLAAAWVWFALFRTRRGFEWRTLGLSPGAAEYSGVAVGRSQTQALAISGAIAGLGGANFVLGYKHFFELGFSGGVGFLGIAVALLGRNHPFGVVLAALVFGVLGHGGLAINARVPRELVNILEALVILLAISIAAIAERRLRKLQ